LAFNGLSQVISSVTLKEILFQHDVKFGPATYAFSIWALIYTLISVFAIYQALPNAWVPSRNNELIFGQIGYTFTINMIANGIWLVIFMTNTNVGFAVGIVDIVVMVLTQIYIM